jgi:hypothetical protein
MKKEKKEKQKKSFLRKIRKHKGAYSVGFTWVYALVSIFAIGLLYIVFDQVFMAHLVPTIKNQVNSSTTMIDTATQDIITGNIDKYMDFWHAMPYILFIVIVIYMFVAAITKERTDEFV